MAHTSIEHDRAALGRIFPGSAALEEFEATQGELTVIEAPCYGERCPDYGKVEPYANYIIIAVDGACRGNGRPDAVAAYGIFFGPRSSYNKACILSEENIRPTSQRAELTAGIKALEAVRRLAALTILPEGLKRIIIKTDSEYLFWGAVDWVFRWRDNGWINAKGRPVVNRDLFQRLDDQIEELEDSGIMVQFRRVPRWQNREADAAANEALDKNNNNKTPPVTRVLPACFRVPIPGTNEDHEPENRAGEGKAEEERRNKKTNRRWKRETKAKSRIGDQYPGAKSDSESELDSGIEDTGGFAGDALLHALPDLFESSSSWGEFFLRQAAFREMLAEAEDALEESDEDAPGMSTIQPTILILSPDSQSLFDDVCACLITLLHDRAQVRRVDQAEAASNYLDSHRPDAILVVDAGIEERKYNTVRQKLRDYVWWGGTAVFCGVFSGFILSSDLGALFRTDFGLSWEAGSYCRATVRMNEPGAANLPSTAGLAPVYSQKALFLRNVECTAAIYVSDEVAPRRQTPAAWAKVGKGWIGYIGDVNGEEATDLTILAMCGL